MSVNLRTRVAVTADEASPGVPIWGPNQIIVDVPPGETHASIENLLADTRYYVRTWNEDQFGTKSPEINSIFRTPPAADPKQVASATTDVVIGATGLSVVNGAITVVSPDGSTTIIDGSSNMFKIAASGTISTGLAASPGSATATVTLTGLGVQSAALAAQLMPNANGSPTGQAGLGSDRTPQTAMRVHYLSASGGTGSFQFVRSDFEAWMRSELAGVAPDNAVIRITGVSQASGTASFTGKYYAFKESAL